MVNDYIMGYFALVFVRYYHEDKEMDLLGYRDISLLRALLCDNKRNLVTSCLLLLAIIFLGSCVSRILRAAKIGWIKILSWRLVHQLGISIGINLFEKNRIVMKEKFVRFHRQSKSNWLQNFFFDRIEI
jgi:hypothetical protein